MTPRILLNGVVTAIEGVPASMTLLDWLRGTAGLPGTKEGCAEGDCGACTVVLERLGADGVVRSAAVNACMLMVGQVDGLGVRTVEGLAGEAGLHPVQAAYVEAGGTQCGFCTPGFVMATYALASAGAADLGAIHDGLAGNLCRCTGYRSIIDAVQQVVGQTMPVLAEADRLASVSRVGDAAFEDAAGGFFAPRSLPAALALRAEHPSARLLAGGTDLGLLASRERTPPPSVIHLAHVPDLTSVRERDGALVIGAAATYSDVLGMLAARHPSLLVYFTRLGSAQIRNMGSLGGNIATASPIGDSLPVLLALDAEIEVASVRGSRRIAAADFFTGYRRTALAEDEIISAVILPALPPDSIVVAEKISKRRDQDISTVAAAFRVSMDGERVGDVRLAFAGVAATPVRARQAEDALRGTRFDDTALAAAIAALPDVVKPIGDWRASGAYRATVAANLLRRLQMRLSGASHPLEVDAL